MAPADDRKKADTAVGATNRAAARALPGIPPPPAAREDRTRPNTPRAKSAAVAAPPPSSPVREAGRISAVPPLPPPPVSVRPPSYSPIVSANPLGAMTDDALEFLIESSLSESTADHASHGHGGGDAKRGK